jgi:hypothetical protein
LYLGTNQGLFVRDFGSKQGFKLVKLGNFQKGRFELDAFDGYLLCGHNKWNLPNKKHCADLISTFRYMGHTKELRA